MKARDWTVALCALAIAAGAILLARRAATMTPTSDTAVIESFTRLAAYTHLQLGPYSRYQWHHPGPLVFYALAPAYALAGEKTVGLNAGALLLNLAGVALALWMAARLASALLATTLAIGMAVLLLRVPELLVSPWNPHVPVVAVLAFLIAAAAAMSATAVGLFTVALCASLAAQAHVALLPLALATGLAATGGYAVSAFTAHRRGVRNAQPPETIARALAATDLLVLVLWAPPLLEQLVSGDGNLTMIWRYFSEQTHRGPSFDVALSAWADMISGPLRPDLYLAHGWAFIESPVRWAEIVTGIEVIALAASTWISLRDRRLFDARLSGVLLGATFLSLWAVTRSDSELFDHVVFWVTAIGALNLGVVLALVVRLIASGRRYELSGAAVAPAAGVLAFALVLSAGFSQLAQEVTRSYSPSPESIAAAEVAATLQDAFRERRLIRPVLRFDQDAWGMAAGVVVDLQRRGISVAVEDDWLAMYTPAFRATGAEKAQVALVGKAQHTRLLSTARDSVIASSGDRLFGHLLVP